MAKANEFQYIDISEILPYKNNPRINKAAIKVVEASIKEFGFQSPIVVSKDYEIIAGHTRFEAAKNLKYGKVPCIVAHSLDDLKAKAYRIADNSTGQIAEWDFSILENEIVEMKNDFDFSIFGIDFFNENNIENFSEQNKEIDVENFKDEMTITLKYTSKKYLKIKKLLDAINVDHSEAVWKLLNA